MKTPSGAKIIGVVESDSAAYITLDWAAAMATRAEHNGKNGIDTVTMVSEMDRNGYNTIWVNVPNKNDIPRIETEIRTLGVGAISGSQAVTEQEKIFNIIGAVLGGIGAIALFVAAIGVINTMVMATLERTREIGIMRALGATKRTVKRACAAPSRSCRSSMATLIPASPPRRRVPLPMRVSTTPCSRPSPKPNRTIARW